ncbi:HD domain-containing protein [Terrilactibacillus sp. S3-3]|nr:HD domain-containing protein [Terrilactibacillus sp. S3-3]
MDSLKQWDAYSYYHSVDDVFVLSTLLARHYRCESVNDFALGCLLHDIGKLGIPKSILLKKGKLTENEYAIVMEHTTYGYHLLKKIGFPERVCKLAHSHHERLNGKGYPDGLTFMQLDRDLKIVMVADVYSALTLSRPYRKPMHATKALQILLRDSHDNH